MVRFLSFIFWFLVCGFMCWQDTSIEIVLCIIQNAKNRQWLTALLVVRQITDFLGCTKMTRNTLLQLIDVSFFGLVWFGCKNFR